MQALRLGLSNRRAGGNTHGHGRMPTDSCVLSAPRGLGLQYCRPAFSSPPDAGRSGLHLRPTVGTELLCALLLQLWPLSHERLWKG